MKGPEEKGDPPFLSSATLPSLSSTCQFLQASWILQKHGLWEGPLWAALPKCGQTPAFTTLPWPFCRVTAQGGE